mmetsp:Transcript_25922/g.41513  ORF Transcript_25922/g.41513 Transcript_25922/m.41513 type:complete len:85 (-) Transcript_25922:218-472(-)
MSLPQTKTRQDSALKATASRNTGFDTTFFAKGQCTLMGSPKAVKQDTFGLLSSRAARSAPDDATTLQLVSPLFPDPGMIRQLFV